jgi:hypothetical protein
MRQAAGSAVKLQMATRASALTPSSRAKAWTVGALPNITDAIMMKITFGFMSVDTLLFDTYIYIYFFAFVFI